MKTVSFKRLGGKISVSVRSGFMQPAIFSLYLWARGDTKPTELGGGVLLNGEPTVVIPDISTDAYHDKILQAVVTVSLVNGKRYAPEVHLIQDGTEIGVDSVDKSTTRNSIGVQFLFLMEGT